MIVKMCTVGAFSTNCYVASCKQTREAAIIDPSFNSKFEAEKIFKFTDENALTIKLVLNTHGHPDHTCGNRIIKEKFCTPILIHENDAHMLGESGKGLAKFFGFENSSPPADVLLRDGDLVRFGKIVLRVVHTPGHSGGSISLLGTKEAFTGDTLFLSSIGRTDFPESSEQNMKASLKKLATLPDVFVVYPGHGPITTVGEEKRNNPFLQSA
ncbi:MBL fold metallo-hydrolase [Candidatus Bathyarchaeota archaeon]|nr:MBL fold metallo-hydrolase [Candidatus Bathyarchaeota archaeon]